LPLPLLLPPPIDGSAERRISFSSSFATPAAPREGRGSRHSILSPLPRPPPARAPVDEPLPRSPSSSRVGSSIERRASTTPAPSSSSPIPSGTRVNSLERSARVTAACCWPPPPPPRPPIFVGRTTTPSPSFIVAVAAGG
ncbi:unnamed protein product, partial [Ectocarpus sp. 12 AP-2014]